MGDKRKGVIVTMGVVAIIILILLTVVTEKPEYREEINVLKQEDMEGKTKQEDTDKVEFDYDHYLEDWNNHIGETITVEGMVIQVLESEEKAAYLLLLEEWETIDYENPKRIIVEETIEMAAAGEEVLVGDIMTVTGTFTGIEHRHDDNEEEKDILTMKIEEGDE